MSSTIQQNQYSQENKRQFPSSASVAFLWFKNEIVAWIKEPAAVLLNMAYPLLMLAFLFVIGGSAVRSNTDIITPAVALLALTGVLMVGINLPANGINEVRQSDFYYYLRTLPTGAGTRLVAWSGAPFLLAILSAFVGIGVGTIFSSARFTFSQVGLLFLVFCAFGVFTTAIGVCFGFVLSNRTSLAVSLGLSFVLLLLSGAREITTLPTVLDVTAKILPSTAAVELCHSILTGVRGSGWWVVSLIIWASLALLMATVAIRRDENSKFS
ncbi:hypothetical protein GWO69_00730 [Corynebacterium macginleyi]|uniref:ABC transporter permease n=1 Tax=Corynebacterium macginleyi TaxID=38290 RepID=UPI000EF99496|nr:hypothetical protein [Corynebacterium macginleyi]MBK4156047.1 hypothetical protein [Corynebacterium macginleyi]MBK4161104.1 hypothetical protein [Corynebacterium macginleyi]MBK4182445.1 hypothetical protein [Corynebacterium macginleyi]QRJ59434.1 hypothetical protein GWO70_008030 [Corynebacterium macginleyi]RMB65277.1 hypothetical protein D9542_10380 [Corynebacterium macginleyi]